MKIICIGRNYRKHAEELGNAVPPEPMFFLKPDSAILPARNPLYIPEWTNDLHYELELVVRIDRLGKYINQEFAKEYYSTVGIGIDFTARDVQAELKEKGHPWEKAKAFDGSAVLGKKWIGLSQLGKGVQELNFTLTKNGDQVQSGNTADMIHSVDHLIAYTSQFMTLKIGDLIFTGTPEGVGKVNHGDVLEGRLEGQKLLSVQIK